MEEAKNLLIQILRNSKGEYFVYLNISGNIGKSEVEFIKVKTVEEAVKVKNELWKNIIEFARINLNSFET